MAELENAFNNLFAGAISNSGDEELLRIASNFARQLSARQIKSLCLLYYLGTNCADPIFSKNLIDFADKVLELLQYNHSDEFVMRALDSISLRKFLNENSIKVNVNK